MLYPERITSFPEPHHMSQEKKAQSKSAKTNEKRRFISIYWKCCHVYSRVYQNKAGTAYQGYCPRCHGFLKVPVGEGGTSQRSFIAG